MLEHEVLHGNTTTAAHNEHTTVATTRHTFTFTADHRYLLRSGFVQQHGCPCESRHRHKVKT